MSAGVGLAIAPFAAIYVAASGVLVGGIAWGMTRRRPHAAGHRVAVVAAGVAFGTFVYFVLALVVGVFGAAPGTGSGSG